MESTTIEKKKRTKVQIEAGHPIVKPEDCPGAVMDWVVERDEKLFEKIENIIDRLFEKHFKKYITMIFWNRIYLILMGVALGGAWCVLLYHLYVR